MPDTTRLLQTIDATWPAARVLRAGPWTLREGQGGGKRVSAATASGQVDPEDLPAAEEAMRMLGQEPLFMIRDKDQALDAALVDRGYRRVDPVNLYRCKVHDLTDLPLPPVSVFHIWEPLAIMREIWEQAGIGPARQAIMDRAKPPRTGLFGRIDDQPAATAFVGIHNGVAMLHALETLPQHQRKGLGKWMMRAAAHWASDWGATWLTTLCVQDNRPANKLYQSLGMQVVAQYHYRVPKDV